MRLRACLAALAAAFVLSSAAPAQEVVIRGDDDSPAGRAAREVLERGQYLWIDRDTILPADFHTDGDLVVYDADVRLAGSVGGTVVVLGGDFFVRPGATVAGPIAVIGGGAFPSRLAETGPILRTEPGAQVVIRGEPAPDGRVRAEVTVQRIRPYPVLSYGLGAVPTYDRVNALTVALGGTVRPTGRDDGARLQGWVSYRTARRSLGGGARAGLPLGTGGLHLEAEVSRATRTNDAWLRGDLVNTLTSFFLGQDFRDYYEADRASVTLSRPLPQALVAGEWALTPRAGVVVSRDRPLEARAPWAVLNRDGLARPNLPVWEATLASAVAGTGFHWRGRVSSLDAVATVERSIGHRVREVPPEVEGYGAVPFTHAVGSGRFQATLFADHELEVRFRGTAALNAGGAPPQRWGLLGGATTLPTLEIGHFQGDNLGFVETTYGVPVPVVELPLVGEPVLELWHAAGAAWPTGTPAPAWVQNLGVGVRAGFLRVRAVADPAERPLRPALSFSLALPGF